MVKGLLGLALKAAGEWAEGDQLLAEARHELAEGDNPGLREQLDNFAANQAASQAPDSTGR